MVKHQTLEIETREERQARIRAALDAMPTISEIDAERNRSAIARYEAERAAARYEALDRINAAFGLAVVGPNDTRPAIEKLARKMVRSGQPVFVGSI